MRNILFSAIFLLAIFASNAVSGQTKDFVVSGTIYDSLSRIPLPLVTVVNQSKNTVTSADDDGKFTIMCTNGDSLLFTFIGYNRQKRIASKAESTLIIFLKESSILLKAVTVYGSYQPHGAEKWSKSIKIQSPFRNPAGPGSGYMVETFGPGVEIGGLLSRLTKSEKEKRQLKTDREKAKRSEIYLSVITSEETKAYFKKTFSMSEDDYNKLIEEFNIAYPQAAYIKSREDIMDQLVNFVALRKN